MINTHFGIFSTETDLMYEMKETVRKATLTMTKKQINSAAMYMARLVKGEKPSFDPESLRSICFRNFISKGIN